MAENAHVRPDSFKRAISLEILRRFGLREIRRHSLANLDRWKAAGTWSAAYAEWRQILLTGADEEIIALMSGEDDRANQMRQIAPYAGMLPEGAVERFPDPGDC